jgi:ankyrin repeat protein
MKKIFPLKIIIIYLFIFVNCLFTSCKNPDFFSGSSSDNSSIVDAARSGKLDIVKKMILDNPSLLNKKDKEGNSLLHIAAKRNDKNMVQFFISKGLPLNQTNDAGMLPLHIAIAKGHYDVTVLFIDKGSKFAYPDIRITALMVAVDYGREDIINMLLSRGADINERGGTPLRIAAENSNLKILNLLLSKGANVNGSPDNINDDLPLKLASRNSNFEMVKILIEKGAKVNDVSGKNMATALHAAAISGSPEVVRLLLTTGAKGDMRDNFNNTPLDYAKKKNRKDIISILESQPVK